MATTASTARNHAPPRSPPVLQFRRRNTATYPPPLLILRRAAGLREQPARPGLNEKNQRDEDENFSQHGPGVGLEQLVDNPHRHAADERSPKISDASKNNHHERIDDVGLAQIRTDV